MNKIVITRLIPPGCEQDAILSGMIEGEKLAEVYLEPFCRQSKLNNIYIGKVQNVVKNINAAFIEFEPGTTGYYPLEELSGAFFTKKQGSKSLVAGDELLVQVAKEPVKTKAAVLTTNLCFPGKYFVITTGKKGIGMSGKLSTGEKTRIKKLVEAKQKDYGVIVRTNAREATDEQLEEELSAMLQKVTGLLEQAVYRTAYSVLSRDEQDYMKLIKNAYVPQMEQIVTDDKSIYEAVQNYLQVYQPEDLEKLVYYEDKLLPLKKLYNLELQLEHATRSHVWLKSGAYLIIEQTEAFHVIDVNTGKFDGKKQKQDTFLKINIEAAKEAARQIRLRNLSGIILVDFINMTKEEYKKLLLKEFAQVLSYDRVRTVVVDMTALGIVEVTRKKERVCLYEALKQF